MAAKACRSAGTCPPDLPRRGHAAVDVTAPAEDAPWLPGSLRLTAPTPQHRCSPAQGRCQGFCTSARPVRAAAPVRLPDISKLQTNRVQPTSTTTAETESTSPETQRAGCPSLVGEVLWTRSKCFLPLALIHRPYKSTSAEQTHCSKWELFFQFTNAIGMELHGFTSLAQMLVLRLTHSCEVQGEERTRKETQNGEKGDVCF